MLISLCILSLLRKLWTPESFLLVLKLGWNATTGMKAIIGLYNVSVLNPPRMQAEPYTGRVRWDRKIRGFPIFPFQAGHVSIHQYFIASHTGLSSTMPAKPDCLVFHRLPQELTPFPAKFCCLLGATSLGWPVSSSVHIHSFRAMAIVPYPGPDRETSRLPILIIFGIQYSPRRMCPHGTKMLEARLECLCCDKAQNLGPIYSIHKAHFLRNPQILILFSKLVRLLLW